MSWIEIGLWVLIVALAFIPPKWDPAIRLKEWAERKRRRG